MKKIFILIFIVCTVSGFSQSKKTWEKTKSINTISAYEDFIKKYPNGNYTLIAKESLLELKFDQVKVENSISAYENYLKEQKNSKYADEAENRLEELYFKQTEAVGTVEAYEAFIMKHYNTILIAKAKQRIDFLNSERDWPEVLKKYTINDFEKFCRNYPGSARVQEAKINIDYLKKKQDELNVLLTNGSVPILQDYCKNNPDSPYLEDAKEAIKYMSSAQDLITLITAGKVKVEPKFNTLQSVGINIRKTVLYPIIVQIPEATLFVNYDESSQNMVTTSEEKLSLTNNEKQTVTIAAACYWTKEYDVDENTFKVIKAPCQHELSNLIKVVKKTGTDFAELQAAIWIITVNANYDDLNKLITYGEPSGKRIINEREVLGALKLCSEAGINIFCRSIWSDKKEIFDGAQGEEYKNIMRYLENGEQKYTAKRKSEEKLAKAKLMATIEWCDIPAGSFMMGSSMAEYKDNGPADNQGWPHEVSLSAFKMSKYEVTFEQYDLFCEATGRIIPKDEGWGRDKRPVINVSWQDAKAFAEYMGCRLPTEAEWEYACRAGTTTPYNTGNTLYKTDANFDNSTDGFRWSYSQRFFNQETNPVGSYKPNLWGLYDMHGNVSEWCSDFYAKYTTTPVNNPTGPATGSYHVNRGGSWTANYRGCRSANRQYNYYTQDWGTRFTGFRIVAVQ